MRVRLTHIALDVGKGRLEIGDVVGPDDAPSEILAARVRAGTAELVEGDVGGPAAAHEQVAPALGATSGAAAADGPAAASTHPITPPSEADAGARAATPAPRKSGGKAAKARQPRSGRAT